MGSYLIRRLLLVIPTLWAIITINFFIVQIAPGGPVDQAIAAIEFGQHGQGGKAADHRRQHRQGDVPQVVEDFLIPGKGVEVR